MEDCGDVGSPAQENSIGLFTNNVTGRKKNALLRRRFVSGSEFEAAKRMRRGCHGAVDFLFFF